MVINKVLLLNWYNTNVRSFVIALGAVVLTAGTEALQAQLTSGKFNWGVVAGASVAAAVKFIHSAATRKVLEDIIF